MGKKLTMCKACAHVVARSARTCPNCGAKLKKMGCLMKIILLNIVFSLIVAAAFYFIFGRGDKPGAGISKISKISGISKIIGASSDGEMSPEDLSSVLDLISGSGARDKKRPDTVEETEETSDGGFQWEKSKVFEAFKYRKMISEVEDASPYVGMSPEDISSVFSKKSNSTYTQRENTVTEIKGRVVQWDGLKVLRVDRYDSGYSLTTSGTGDRPGTMLKVYNFKLSSDDKTYIELLSEGDLITAKGKVSGTFMGPSSNYIQLDPAVIVY